LPSHEQLDRPMATNKHRSLEKMATKVATKIYIKHIYNNKINNL